MKSPLDSCFPVHLRIRRSSDFKEVFAKGKRLHTEHYVIFSAPNSLGLPRLGLSVGKKVSGNAVARNRVKRIMREVFRNNKQAFDSLDTLIVSKKGSETLGYRCAEREITRAMVQNLE